jgi:hypothetical protein
MRTGCQIGQIKSQPSARFFTTSRILLDDETGSGKPHGHEKSLNSVTLLGNLDMLFK